MSKICTKCGIKLGDTDRFCNQCGTPFGNSKENESNKELARDIVVKEIKDEETRNEFIKSLIWTVFSIGGTFYVPFPIWMLILLIIIDIMLIIHCVGLKSEIKRKMYCFICPRCQQKIMVPTDKNVAECPMCATKLVLKNGEFEML